MPIRYLSDPELARLSSWPDEIAAEDAVTYFTLSTDDLSRRAGSNRAGEPPGRCHGADDAAVAGLDPGRSHRLPGSRAGPPRRFLAIDPPAEEELLARYGELAGPHAAGIPGTGDGPAGLELMRCRRAQAARRGLAGPSARTRRAPRATGGRPATSCRPSGSSGQRWTRWAVELPRRDAARAEPYHPLAPLLHPPRPLQLGGLLDVVPDVGVTRGMSLPTGSCTGRRPSWIAPGPALV